MMNLLAGMNNLRDTLNIRDLTIFLITTNENTTKEAYKALLEQNCNFKIIEINNIFPMYRAFQKMSDLCTTKYFIQVDADMILNKDAINYLYNGIKKSPFWVYRYSASLYEEGFGKGGAVKCWKKSVFKIFKFRDVRTVDRDFQARAALLCLRIKHSQKIIGIHKARFSKFSEYLKTKSDIEKWKFLKRKYNKYAKDLITKLYNDDNNSIRFGGALLGSINSLRNIKKSKDIKKEELFYNKFIKNILVKDILLRKNDKNDLINLFEIAYSDFYCKNNDNKIKLINQLCLIYNISEIVKEEMIKYL